MADVRLRRSDPTRPGWSRRRRGRGFSYVDARGRPLDEEDARRCRELSIPPAWTDVWICPWPQGHLQAVGTDDAGRRQYLYHPAWREARDREKFDRVLEFGARLPQARATVRAHLRQPGMPRERALATAFRILDLGGVRVGGETYAQLNGTVGLATLRREHVSTRGGRVRLRFPGKAGKPHDVQLEDPDLVAAVRVLLARRSGGAELLAWRDGTAWVDVTSADVNAYVREVTGAEATAKDFRTWQAAVLTLASLAARLDGSGRVPGRREVAQAMREVADHLGNTPTVARTAYVDPRVVQAVQTEEAQLPDPPDDTDDLPGWEQCLLRLLAPHLVG